MLIGLLGVELLVGVVRYAGLVEVIAKQRRPHHQGHHPGGDSAGEQNQRLRQQKPAAHPESIHRAHHPLPIR